MSTTKNTLLRLVGLNTELLVLTDRWGAEIRYWGPRLRSEASVSQLSKPEEHPLFTQGLEFHPKIRLSTLGSDGYIGQPSIKISGSANACGLRLTLIDAKQESSKITIRLGDPQNGIELEQVIELADQTDVFQFQSTITNKGDSQTVGVDWLASACIQLADNIQDLITFSGYWSKEFKTSRKTIEHGIVTKENRRGRTSHDNFPGMYVCGAGTTEVNGPAMGFHLGWSGNHRLTVEQTAENFQTFQAGELLLPDEIQLSPGEQYQSPVLYGTSSNHGLNGVSQSFHRYVRNITRPRKNKIHLNTWEAVYFDHDIDTLKQLATDAAKLGVERFVLDDGWFKGRKTDESGLGDWTVDKANYPDGLHPLIDHVLSCGLEFGIWFEPEMVNEDSDLFRKHPDWILSNPSHERFLARHQLVLDLNKQEVFDYLYHSISAVLEEYPISYIKWDMNRDLHQPISTTLDASVHKQTRALYALLAKLRVAFPAVEIESCASGGGRTDYGILQYTNRIWTSDNNDPVERIKIQKGCSYFFPPDIMGAHIGPEHAHITGRATPLDLRIAVSLAGHAGIECNVSEMTDQDTSKVKAGFELYKKIRPFTESSAFYRGTSIGDYETFQFISEPKDEALIFCFHYEPDVRSHTQRIFVENLEERYNYRIERLWPDEVEHAHWIEKNISIHNTEISGELLKQNGLILPRILTDRALILRLIKT